MMLQTCIVQDLNSLPQAVVSSLPQAVVSCCTCAKGGQAAPAIEQQQQQPAARLELEAPADASAELGAESAVEAVRELHAGVFLAV